MGDINEEQSHSVVSLDTEGSSFAEQGLYKGRLRKVDMQAEGAVWTQGSPARDVLWFDFPSPAKPTNDPRPSQLESLGASSQELVKSVYILAASSNAVLEVLADAMWQEKEKTQSLQGRKQPPPCLGDCPKAPGTNPGRI